MQLSFKDKVIVITGASRGIGRAIAIRFAQAGASVAINYADNEAAAQETMDAAISHGGICRKYQADVADYGQVCNMMSHIAADFNGVDILINNAGVLLRSFLMMTSSDDFRRVMDINTLGVFNCTKAGARYMMQKKKGVIVNISSLAGLRGLVGQTAYASSKAAVNTLTKLAAKEFARHGIRINAISPGCIDVGMMKELDETVRQGYIEQIPLRRYGSAEEVAEAVLFLASDSASYITGHVLTVDGGMLT